MFLSSGVSLPVLMLKWYWRMMESLCRRQKKRRGEKKGRENIHIIDVQRPDISQPLDVGRALLALRIGHVQVQLLYSALDGVPAGQPRCEVDVSGEPKVGGIDDLIGARVREDGLSVDAGLVGEGAEPGDVVVEGDVDLDGLRDEILQVSELVQFVLAHDVVAVGDNHAGHQTAERGDAVPLSDAQHGGVDVGRPGLERTVGVRDGAPSVVVEMCLNIARDNAPQGADEVVDLSRRRTSNGVGDALKRKEKEKI